MRKLCGKNNELATMQGRSSTINKVLESVLEMKKLEKRFKEMMDKLIALSFLAPFC